MKILSIDVGMKHLAYCLFDVKSTNVYSIEMWDVMNLCRTGKQVHKCMGFTKKKTPCNKSPKLYKNGEFYCRIHAKNHAFKIPTNNLKEKKIKNLKLLDLKYLMKQLGVQPDKKVGKVRKNGKITFKKSEYMDTVLKHINEEYFNFIEKLNTKDFNLVTYGRNLRINFNDVLKDTKIDRVIIENQIGPLALRMKTLQGMIMQHFIERNCSIIEEISPVNKLKAYIHKKTTYNERKKLSIEITQKKCKEDIGLEKWENHFLSHKKKDDLADALLQGLWYLKSSGLMVF